VKHAWTRGALNVDQNNVEACARVYVVGVASARVHMSVSVVCTPFGALPNLFTVCNRGSLPRDISRRMSYFSCAPVACTMIPYLFVANTLFRAILQGVHAGHTATTAVKAIPTEAISLALAMIRAGQTSFGFLLRPISLTTSCVTF